ncbi:MAG TPA: dethiobiotin synthase [Solirubrobacteraceae bacterium]|jgi:dethiobiotin synthetase|nr:dethiobiotin synthase [Solirubrobacteraceae bacterium]
MRGLFVTGTDTGVGKTIVSAALLASLAAAGEPVRAYKPVVTGLEDPAETAARGRWPPDHELLGAAAGMSPRDVAPLRYGPAVSPHLAAELAGERIDPERLLAAARAGTAGETLIAEGVGGLLTPLAEDYSVCDLAAAIGLPVLIAARPGLGTINHTLLTLRVARAAGLQVRGVVLNPWPEEPTSLHRSNHSTIARLGEVQVERLSLVPRPTLDCLARAGSPLVRAFLSG